MPMHFAIFPVHVSKVLRLPRKSDARSYEVLHLSRKIISANLKNRCSKCNPSQEISPSSPNTSNSCVSCSALATRNASFQIVFKCPTPAIVFEIATKPHVFYSLLTRCRIPCACHAKRYPNVQKCSVPRSFFALLSSKCASRHNGMHFFDMSTSKVV